MGLIITTAFIIFTLINPSLGSIVFMVLIVLVEGYSGFMIYSKPKLKIDDKYNHAEKTVIEKYHVFFMYPFASRSLSAFLSAIQLSVFILTPYLIWKGLWIQGAIIGINYFVVAQFAVPLNPQHFLHEYFKRGKIKDPKFATEAKEEMEAIDSALHRMYLEKK